MSTHKKFNPEGVKGKTAKPPHNFFKIMKYSIIRDKQLSENHTVSVAVKTFDCIEDALDTMYSQARRHGYEVTIDNTPDGRFGFCLWQIQVVVGQWTYHVVEHCCDMDGNPFDDPFELPL